MASTRKLICREVRYGSKEYDATLTLRDAALRKPLGIKFTDDELAKEEGSFHLSVWKDTDLAACVVLTPLAGVEVQLRQCVVREDLRGGGCGKMLVDFAETFALEKQFQRIVMHARVTAAGFYERLGYKVEGKSFIEIGIPHVTMRKGFCPSVQ